MAVVQGPLMSLDAKGTFGKTIVYQGRLANVAVFPVFKPYDPKSISQLNIREYVARGIYYWKRLDPAYRAAWNSFIG